MNQITPQLYITDIETARRTASPTDVVVTVCQDDIEDNVSEKCSYKWFNMSDGDTGYGGRSDYGIFKEACDAVISHLEKGDSVLVHCHVGKSRSAAVCIASLAVFEKLRYNEAYKKVKEARSFINPDSLLVEHANRYINESMHLMENQ